MTTTKRTPEQQRNHEAAMKLGRIQKLEDYAREWRYSDPATRGPKPTYADMLAKYPD